VSIAEAPGEATALLIEPGLPELPSFYLEHLKREGYCLLPRLIPHERALEAKAVVTALEAEGAGGGNMVRGRLSERRWL
jgi:hypothetical protein